MPTYTIANDAVTLLTTQCLATDVTIYVENASLFPLTPQFDVKVGSEIMLVTFVNANAWTVQRGQQGTQATYHPISSTVKNPLTAAFLNWLITGTGSINYNAVFPGFSGSAETLGTTFNSNGSIVQTYPVEGVTVTTTFLSNGNISQVFLFPGSVSYTITTSFGSNGNPVQVITSP